MITITHNHNGTYTIKDDNGNKCSYYFHNRREALSRFRHDFGYTRKRVGIVNIEQ